ncbi:4-fold beta flower protein [Croceibacter atlanticus]|uniref:4-fold beta flower protein n=1 Tax=Croceibacter atlanticus TaxID=313588 RepID=UPI0030F63917
MTFYDRNGHPQFYCQDKEFLYDFNGSPIGYFYNNSIYNFKGNHLGWFEDGWIIDPNGYRFCFNEDANGGPMKPMKSMKPTKGMKSMKPMKSMKEMRPMKPMKSLSWSNMNIAEFFRN